MFGGEVYIKATDLARQYHYTADYLGQLARQGKVNARLAGRSWYMEEASLLEYRKRDIVRAEPQLKSAPMKPAKVAKKLVAKRETMKKRVHTNDATPVATAPKERVSKRKTTKTKTAKKPLVLQSTAPTAVPAATHTPRASVGLWQKASSWLRKFKGE
jgi:hypothetical protein